MYIHPTQDLNITYILSTVFGMAMHLIVTFLVCVLDPHDLIIFIFYTRTVYIFVISLLPCCICCNLPQRYLHTEWTYWVEISIWLKSVCLCHDNRLLVNFLGQKPCQNMTFLHVGGGVCLKVEVPPKVSAKASSSLTTMLCDALFGF